MFSKTKFSPDLCWKKIDTYKDIYNFGDEVPLLKTLYIRRTNTPLDYSPSFAVTAEGRGKQTNRAGWDTRLHRFDRFQTIYPHGFDIIFEVAEGFWPRLTFHVPMKSYHLREREVTTSRRIGRRTTPKL